MDEDARIEKLNSLIGELFESSSLDKVELVNRGFGSFHDRMFEISEIDRDRAKFVDLYEPLEFPNVLLPVELAVLMRSKDVFLAHLAFRGASWHILWLSP